MLRASLVVQSRELTLAEISAPMGRQPDQGHDRGSLAPVRGVSREWSTWSVDLQWPSDLHGGTAGLAFAIEALGPELAERAGRLAARGCDVVISVRQEMADVPTPLGLHLTAGAIRWLALAGADVDIDQYLEEGAGG